VIQSNCCGACYNYVGTFSSSNLTGQMNYQLMCHTNSATQLGLHQAIFKTDLCDSLT